MKSVFKHETFCKIRLVLYFSIIFFSSCQHSKTPFNDYVNKLKQSKFQEDLRNYRLTPVRGMYQLTLPDTTRIQLELSKDGNFKVNWVEPSRKYDTLLIKSILNRCKEFHVIAFEKSKISPYFSIYFDLRYIQGESLPKYFRREQDSQGNGLLLGVLNIAYDQPEYEKSGFFRYYQPIKIDSLWYYFETFFLRENIPKHLL